eukprot:scaffold22917_cov55-Cyclotella_meneghiniana.AAC.3
MSCHNLLQSSALPPGTKKLLGLGLNYCIRAPSILSTTANTHNRMIEDVRRIYHLKDNIQDDDDYIKQLYIKSDYVFDPASDEIEEAVSSFTNAIKTEQLRRSHRKKPTRNLTRRQWELVKFFKDHDRYIIIFADKNLGPCILERRYYILRGCTEHLANETNYRQVSKEWATARINGLRRVFERWLGKYQPRTRFDEPVDYICISSAEETFLIRAKKRPDGFSKFRMTGKVHKDPFKMRPIVACCYSFMNDWSKWLDFWFQQLKHLIPSYVKDSQQVLDELKALILPPNARVFTGDANSMYNNIDTEHAITVITQWLRDLDSEGLLPYGFPLDAVLDAMKIIMRNNIFEFGDCYFLQLIGTAMGTSAAVMWATIYFAVHEKHILANHSGNLLYYKRFIDDIFGIWIGNTTNEWSSFCDDINNFGVLTWDIGDNKPSLSVDFLDLTIMIRGSKIETKTFQKKMNLYLYIPPSSAHPTGCIKGTVFGLIRRYHAQNTHRKDFIAI